jgi:hypothetical protein
MRPWHRRDCVPGQVLGRSLWARTASAKILKVLAEAGVCRQANDWSRRGLQCLARGHDAAVMLPLEFFERLSCMYRAQLMDPWWRWYTAEPGPQRALALFAGQYAYERQGRARSYPHAAYFAIEKTPALDAAEIWHALLSELDDARPNRNLNPLYHTGAPCNCVCCTFR